MYANYPEPLAGELKSLKLVSSSVSSLCDYFRALFDALANDDREEANRVLAILFDRDTPPPGIHRQWEDAYRNSEHLIEGGQCSKIAAAPLHLLADDELDALPDHLRTLGHILAPSTARRVESAHGHVIQLAHLILQALSGLENELDSVQWLEFKTRLGPVLTTEFAAIQMLIRKESLAAANRARETFLRGTLDTKRDNRKNVRKKRFMTKAAHWCAREYRWRKRQVPMRQIVRDYVAENGGSEKSIRRTLSDNPDQWKDDK